MGVIGLLLGIVLGAVPTVQGLITSVLKLIPHM
jgi:hypothetical protein